ncbi:Cystine-knot cytokine,PDGF/VEGF domain [Cinara cedri]|uniref:Cystine-knot cytokine,PDGF/VEGF domain n=1 Tax=Cinara cedri TaxID=506608 RepID=A0A5E4MPZ8_9HEMI|nr:Cystine-knot cytokine,PDGF/VEGF domain [Cinara cedri]
MCKTDITAVSLIDEKDEGNPNIQYTPSCTRVTRCGGCCGSNLISCQPTQVETLNFPVKILEYNGTHFVFKEKKNVTVPQHVACKCDCTIKHCKPSQMYNPKGCNCICNNTEDQYKCNAERDTKMWDSDSCSCKCRKVENDNCTTGSEFNNNTCGCEPTE